MVKSNRNGPASHEVAKAIRLGGKRSQDGAIQLAEQIPAATFTFLGIPVCPTAAPEFLSARWRPIRKNEAILPPV
jgi:hypothetical protein